MNPLAITVSLYTLNNAYYNLPYIPAIILVLVVNRIFAYKYRTNRLQTFLYTVSMIVFGFIGSHIGAYIYNWFQEIRGLPGRFDRTVFGTIIMVVAVTLVFVFLEKGIRLLIGKIKNSPVPGVRLRDVYDAIQPGAFILVMFTKVRCLMIGCCSGNPSPWGIYSKHLKTVVVPVQIFEMFMTFSILIITYFITQTRFFRRGMALFLSGGMFAFGRFFLEFIMYYGPENRTYLGHFTFFQCVCILIFVVCVTVIVFLYKTQPSDPLPGKLRPIFEEREKKKPPRAPKQTVSQKRYSKQWQSTKKKYKKKK